MFNMKLDGHFIFYTARRPCENHSFRTKKNAISIRDCKAIYAIALLGF